MRGLLVALLLVVACDEHGKHPDGGLAFCNCGAGSHCEAQCQAGFTEACMAPCFAVCVADSVCPTCTVNTTCADSCSRDCRNKPETCTKACVPPGTCSSLSETECNARADCFVIRHGEGCTCDATQACTCANPNGAFARCDSIMP